MLLRGAAPYVCMEAVVSGAAVLAQAFPNWSELSIISSVWSFEAFFQVRLRLAGALCWWCLEEFHTLDFIFLPVGGRRLPQRISNGCLGSIAVVVGD